MTQANKIASVITPKTFQTLTGFLIFMTIVVLSRLPFLFNGYGSEEDSWGMVNALMRTNATGIYETSRFPGHPFVEAVLYFTLPCPPFVGNLITTLLGAAGLYFFALALIRLNLRSYLHSTWLLAFTPVLYINSTNNMDYIWAFAFAMAAFYFLTRLQFVLAGLFIGVAAGCRLTSLLYVIPFAVLVFQNGFLRTQIRQFIIMSSVSVIVTLICYYPLFKEYAFDFLTHPDTLGYPGFFKTLYKASVGVFGTIGSLALICFLILAIKKNKKESHLLMVFSVAGILVFVVLFIYLPQKAAFLIPALPFLYLFLGATLQPVQMNLLALVMTLSCFFAGISIDNELRGSDKRDWSFNTTIASQPVMFTLDHGPLQADYEKRKNKIIFANRVVQHIDSMTQPSLIIAGFWINETEVLMKRRNPHVVLTYFASPQRLKTLTRSDTVVYYLPEQDAVNDLKYHQAFTIKYARPLFKEYNGTFVY